VIPERYSIFLSHTKDDKEFCNRFDNAAASVGLRRFRSEFEKIEPPAWKTIKTEIDKSSALFLLIGKELVKSQESKSEEWKYTQNWISYEVGLACAIKKDVWVWCEEQPINFPVPYLNNYVLYGFGSTDEPYIGFLKIVLEGYNHGLKFPLGWGKRGFKCPHNKCGAQFNLHNSMPKGSVFACPTCLREITLNEDWLMDLHKKRRKFPLWSR